MDIPVLSTKHQTFVILYKTTASRHSEQFLTFFLEHSRLLQWKKQWKCSYKFFCNNGIMFNLHHRAESYHYTKAKQQTQKTKKRFSHFYSYLSSKIFKIFSGGGNGKKKHLQTRQFEAPKFYHIRFELSSVCRNWGSISMETKSVSCFYIHCTYCTIYIYSYTPSYILYIHIFILYIY